MKIVSNKPKTQRIKKCLNVTYCGKKKVRRPFLIEPIGINLWFDATLNKWTNGFNSKHDITSSYYAMTGFGLNNVYSLKAAKRLIHKWEVPKGTKFIVSLPFIGHHFLITK